MMGVVARASDVQSPGRDDDRSSNPRAKRKRVPGGDMKRVLRASVITALLVAAGLVIGTGAVDSSAGEVQLRLGREYLDEGRYDDALQAYKKALTQVGADDMRQARAGVIQSALRVAEFDLARSEAE